MVSEILHDNYYLLLSEPGFSIVMPVSRTNMDEKQIEEFHRTVNRKFVGKGNLLTDDVYVYRKITDKLEMIRESKYNLL